jgi:tetratricopeptide (TPR) repeat protein
MSKLNKGRIRSVALLSLGLSLLLAGCGSTMAEVAGKLRDGYQAQRSYEGGLDRYEAKDFAGAIPWFQQGLRLEPTWAEVEAYLAWSYYHSGAYTQATQHFRQAIGQEPRWEGLHDGLGWSRYRVGRYHIALEAFQDALALDPRYRDAAVGVAYSLFELGRYEEAVPHLERLTREGEGNGLQSPARNVEHVRSRLAWTLFYLGEYGKAREQFTKGIAARPDWYGLYNGLGWAYLRLGDPARARENFGRALQLKPDLEDARQGIVLPGS